ncbi:MAG: phytanoyl-CoA dioxygenase [Rhodospirillaceae bacterium]|nr:phytanoyl-CoA dioxygenase [Rhodospirillaceae bacterium]
MNEISERSGEPLTKEAHAEGLRAYREAGQKREQAIGNRGPLRLGDDGKLHPDILEAFHTQGFYIFEGVIDADEIAALRHDANVMLERAPVNRDAKVDAQGQPALGIDYARLPYRYTKPLADPWGGTAQLGGRHPTQMTQPKPEADAPEDVVFIMYSMCQSMPAGLRLYGHPGLLTVAESINGTDFVPFNDAIFVKQPGLGGSVSWHQDGVTHWDSPDWDPGIHGFNFQVQLYPATLGNCLWVVPGSHKLGRIDIKARVAANGGSEQLPDAVPLVCEAGDVTIVNRQMLHGSFANSSPDLRISLTFGFHRRQSVLGAKAALAMEDDNVTYDEQRVFERSAVVQVAIDARYQDRPDEPRFDYKPFSDLQDDFRFNDETFERVIKNYHTKDLAI